MRTLYARQWTEKVTSGHSLKVYTERVGPGQVLKVDACFFHVPETTAGELLTIYLEDGGQNIVMRSRAMTTALDGMSIFTPFSMGEGDRLFGYAPSASEGDTLALNIVGELMTRGDWIKR